MAVHGGTAALIAICPVFSGSGDQADGNIAPPALTVSGRRRFRIAKRQWLTSACLTSLVRRMVLQEIGGVDVTPWEPLDMLAGEWTYGRPDCPAGADPDLPGQYPAYDGVLYGQVGSLQVIDFRLPWRW